MTVQTTDATTTQPWWQIPQPWWQPCAQPRNTFQHGTRIRHRNPKFATWRGVVVAPATGEHRGRCLRLSQPFDGDALVHIRWTAGTGRPPMGWFNVRAIALADDPPTISLNRLDLAHRRHTITVERIDVETARAYWGHATYRQHVGELAVIERHDGWLARVCFTETDNVLRLPMEKVARGVACTYGATYIDLAGNAR